MAGRLFRLLQDVQGTLPFSLAVPSLGFGYPSDGFRSHDPWRTFSTSNTLGLHSSELWSKTAIETGFPVCFRSRAFLENLSASHRRLSDLFLPSQLSPMPPGFLSQIGIECSHEPFGFSGVLLRKPRSRYLPDSTPLILSPFPPFSGKTVESQGSFSYEVGIASEKAADPSNFFTDCHSPPLKIKSGHGLFFHLGNLFTLQ